ncbi:uroporphyrinogen-III synthase [Helicobacter sp. MIT 11-5569]|uniref:uroporphyrinogen-III synthase n=1 Tax=Helicobacter sp. MIT 11-5569 TaxID=1548151 RepID=UPI00051F9732|nr:uroporphyrinogen-III synthase [Helicobacter sp. MIT 11-5569]TLD84080.1 uroporphyrinogen-III synthase [Helicobacter sp. MIT 11-5569]
MVYYITKTNPNLAHLPITKDVAILPLITLQTQFVSNIGTQLQQCDSLIFTSKNAIYALNENLESLEQSNALKERWKSLPNFVIGQGSANALKELGMQAEFIATRAYGEIFAQELMTLLQGKKPLFLRAKKIASEIPKILRENGIALQEAILYENTPNLLENPPKLQRGSMILFSAPSHIEAFLLNFVWDCSYIAICIGASTKKAAQKLLQNAEILQSPEPNAHCALEFALRL